MLWLFGIFGGNFGTFFTFWSDVPRTIWQPLSQKVALSVDRFRQSLIKDYLAVRAENHPGNRLGRQCYKHPPVSFY
jgi:hypothetical protein